MSMIEPPFYRKDAKPTPEGWRHPTTGELLKPQKLTEDEINAYLGIGVEAEPEHVDSIEDDPTVDEIEEEAQSVETDYDLQQMNKTELEELGREHGIELDRRKNKSDLIEELKEVL